MDENKTDDSHILRELVRDLINAGQWGKARVVAELLTSMLPEDGSAHTALGIVWLGLYDLQKAEQSFLRAMDVGGENAKTCLLMARLNSFRGDLRQQLQWALRAGQLDNDNPEPWLIAADAYIRLGQLKDSEGILKRLSDAHPQNIQVKRMLGHVYLDLQRLDEAADEFRAALSLQPDDSSLWTDLGHTLSMNNEFKQACEAFQRAAELEPRNPEYAYNLGDNYLALENPEKALAFLVRAVQLSPDHRMAHYDLGLAFFELRRYEECAQSSIASLRSDPCMETQRSNPGVGATANIGLAYMNLGKFKEAEECFLRNLKLMAPSYFNLGLVLFRQGLYERSLINFQRALELEPEDPEYLDLLGNAYSELGRLTEAEKVLRHAIAIDSKYALAHYDLGTVLATVKGKEVEALKSFKRAIAHDPGLYWGYYSIACLYALMDKKKLALRFLKKAFQKGFSNMSHLEKDSDLDSLRDDPTFGKLMDKYCSST